MAEGTADCHIQQERVISRFWELADFAIMVIADREEPRYHQSPSMLNISKELMTLKG